VTLLPSWPHTHTKSFNLVDTLSVAWIACRGISSLCDARWRLGGRPKSARRRRTDHLRCVRRGQARCAKDSSVRRSPKRTLGRSIRDSRPERYGASRTPLPAPLRSLIPRRDSRRRPSWRISEPVAKSMPECPFHGTMVHWKGRGIGGLSEICNCGVQEVVNGSDPRELLPNRGKGVVTSGSKAMFKRCERTRDAICRKRVDEQSNWRGCDAGETGWQMRQRILLEPHEIVWRIIPGSWNASR
jgi:hypothetical protein